jgi:hypothetical protein
MKAYTDFEQSKKLAKILSLESADMEYLLEHWIDEETYRHKEGYCEIPVVKVDDDCPLQPITLDCWSLEALLNILPHCIDVRYDLVLGKLSDNKGWYVMYDDVDHFTKFYVTHSNLIDACVEMILKLHEQKLL